MVYKDKKESGGEQSLEDEQGKRDEAMEGDRDFCEEDSENRGQGERDRDYHGEDSEDEQGVGDSDDNISEDDTQDEHGGERDVMMDFSDGGEARKAEKLYTKRLA